MEAHLTTGLREMGGGLERYTFEVASSGVTSAAERLGRVGLQQFFASVYCISPRPDPREIISFKMTPLHEGRSMRVELLIQRGHYQMLQWLHEHEDLFVKKDGSVRCSCHPGETRWLVREQLPDYEKEFGQ